jgi:hypothetical protein
MIEKEKVWEEEVKEEEVEKEKEEEEEKVEGEEEVQEEEKVKEEHVCVSSSVTRSLRRLDENMCKCWNHRNSEEEKQRN